MHDIISDIIDWDQANKAYLAGEGQSGARYIQRLEAADTGSLYASVLTLGEIRFGVELLPPSKRRTQLEQWLDRDLPE